MLRTLFDHYAEEPPPAVVAGRVRSGAGGRLACRDDRSLRHPRIRRPLAAAGLLMCALHARVDRARSRRGRHGRARGVEDRPAAGGLAPARGCARSTTSARPRSRSTSRTSSSTASAATPRAMRDRIRRADRGARLPRSRRVPGRALGSSARARERGPPGRGAAPAQGAAARAARPGRALLRELPVGLRRGRPGAGLPDRPRPLRGDPARIQGRLLAERMGPDAAGSAPERLQRGGADGGRACPARAGRRRVRPLSRANHVPAGGRARPRPRLRSAPDGGGTRAEVPEHQRERAVPQGPPAVRPRYRAEGGGKDAVGSCSSRVTPTCSRSTRPEFARPSPSWGRPSPKSSSPRSAGQLHG